MNSFKQFFSISAIALGIALPMSGFSQTTAETPKAEASQQASLSCPPFFVFQGSMVTIEV